MKPLVTTIATTVVSKEVIYTDGKLLAEMTDGRLLQFSLYTMPKYSSERSFMYLTKEQLVEKVGGINAGHMADSNHMLHLDKVRRLGQDYRDRGYR